MEPTAVDDRAHLERTLRGLDGHAVGASRGTGHPGAEPDVDAGVGQLAYQRGAHLAVVDDAGAGHPEGRHPFDVGFAGTEAGAVEALGRDVVLGRPDLEGVESGAFVVGHRDDDLAAHVVGDPVVVEEGHQVVAAGGHHRRLAGVGLVVDAGMDHAGVAPRLMDGGVRLLLEDDDATLRIAGEQRPSRGEAQDPGTDDGHVGPVGGVHVRSPRRRVWGVFSFSTIDSIIGSSRRSDHQRP